VPGDGAVVVHVVNTNLEGQSRRPGICVGTTEEVDRCLASLGVEPEADEGVEPDMGAPDEGVEADMGPEVDMSPQTDMGQADQGADQSASGDDGCSATPGAPGSAPWALLFLALPLLFRRRK